MTETLHLGHLRVIYRVDHDDPVLRRQLDGVLERVLDEGLEPALARSGVTTDEEICIRSLRVPVRLRLDGGETNAAATWSAALAEAIAAALRNGPRPDVVRFRSRRAALADLALGVAAGRLERIWAWRQLGLWRGGDAPGERAAAWELASTLVSEPESIVPVLAEVAAAGTLASLVERIEPAAWADLARAALAAADAPATLVDEAQPAPAGSEASGESRHPNESARARAARAQRASAIGRGAAVVVPRAPSAVRAELARALAVLAMLEAEPSAGSSGGSSAEVAGELARTLLGAAGEEPARTDSGPGPAEAEPPRAEDAPAPAAGGEQTETEPEPEGEPRWTTAYAGLLFLLPVLGDLGVPDAVTRAAPLARRPLRWSLHRLALTLAPVDTRDPAALAFAGVAPDADPPSDEGEPWGDAELDALAAIREQIDAHLRERLERPDAAAGELVELVSRRSGEIVFDPGWIELRLPLGEVSTEIRRAGLDLDPGWIPWLGAIVRFVYG